MVCEGQSVLIVDDEPQVCALLREELAAEGFRCEVAVDSRWAQKLLARETFAVLVADVSMPNITGLDLLAEVAERSPGTRVILITGLREPRCIAQALMLGAYDYFNKPFRMPELVAAVRKACDAEQTQSALPFRAAEAMSREADDASSALESVRALARAVEAKDPCTRRHSDHVAAYAMKLAEVLGLDEEVKRQLHTAALLHDAGKIGVPDHLLTKPARLSPEEFAFIRLHPELGEQIVSQVSLFAVEATLIRHHHEDWMGTGYPDGLRGEEIPLPSRIIRVADSMDAMLMDRVYKEPCTVEQMIGELRMGSGRQFDPEIAGVAILWASEHADELVSLFSPERIPRA